jgi:two-component system nitrogen regulation response regulator NtrX
MHDGSRISLKTVREMLRQGPRAQRDEKESPASLPGNILELNFSDAKESFEKYYLEFQLSRNNSIISRTAEAIGIYPSNLHAKLRKHGIVTHS